MEKTFNVRVPEVLAGKVDRLATLQGMTQSEFVRAALREYVGKLTREAMDTVSREIRPVLEAEGITEENVVEWYRTQVRKSRKTNRKAEDRAGVLAR